MPTTQPTLQEPVHWDPETYHHLNAAVGWAELGSFDDATHELDQLGLSFQFLVPVLSLRCAIELRRRRLPEALALAKLGIQLYPNRGEFYLGAAQALRAGGREAAALTLLRSTPASAVAHLALEGPPSAKKLLRTAAMAN